MKNLILLSLVLMAGVAVAQNSVYCGIFHRSDSLFKYKTASGEVVDYALEVKRDCDFTHEDSSFVAVDVPTELRALVKTTFDNANRPSPEMCVEASWFGADPCGAVIGPHSIQTFAKDVKNIWEK